MGLQKKINLKNEAGVEAKNSLDNQAE